MFASLAARKFLERHYPGESSFIDISDYAARIQLDQQQPVASQALKAPKVETLPGGCLHLAISLTPGDDDDDDGDKDDCNDDDDDADSEDYGDVDDDAADDDDIHLHCHYYFGSCLMLGVRGASACGRSSRDHCFAGCTGSSSPRLRG